MGLFTVFVPAHCVSHRAARLPIGMSHMAACGWSRVHVDSGPVWPCTLCSDCIKQLYVEYWRIKIQLYDLQASETATMHFLFLCLPSLLCYCPMQVREEQCQLTSSDVSCGQKNIFHIHNSSWLIWPLNRPICYILKENVLVSLVPYHSHRWENHWYQFWSYHPSALYYQVPVYSKKRRYRDHQEKLIWFQLWTVTDVCSNQNCHTPASSARSCM